ncbi:MAG: hypothetical protein V2I33_20065, partial [Kangiellaceae bacterium]|nr:hypothetical protein [Kangiellaceae bacterium]
SKFGDAWFILDVLIDFLFFMDVCVNLSTAYYDIDGTLITSRCKIFCHYLKSWMILDIIA